MTKFFLPSALALLALTRPATAQSALDDFMTAPAGRFGLSYRGAFNVRASFNNFGAFPAASNPGPAAGGGVDRFYDDGFNRVDASGNAGGLTTYWGYQNEAQALQNDTLVLHSSSVASGHDSSSTTDDPQHGFELSYTWPLSTGSKWRWGVEGAFGFTALSFRQNQSYAGNVVQISDAFALGGITPPVAPYSGTFSGPGPLLGDTPTRTVTTLANAAAVVSQARMDGALYQLRLGPYFELPLGQRVAVLLGGGVVGAFVHSDFEFYESAILPGGSTFAAAGADSNSDALIGGYASAQLSYVLSRHVALSVGGQYQTMGRSSQSAGGREAQLDWRNVMFFTGGLSYAF
jgi:hypothetical protein